MRQYIQYKKTIPANCHNRQNSLNSFVDNRSNTIHQMLLKKTIQHNHIDFKKNVSQLLSYRDKKNTNNSVYAEFSANSIKLIDSTPKEYKERQKQGDMSGYANYYIAKSPLEEGASLEDSTQPVLVLTHFYTFPPRMGLGKILMFELTHIAQKNSCNYIQVTQPASSAMGAYLSFDGLLPLNRYQEDLHTTYYSEMQTNPRPFINFIEEEAKAYAESRILREKFDNTEIYNKKDLSEKENKENETSREKEYIHEYLLRYNKMDDDDVKRVALYKAYTNLTYEVMKLKNGLFSKIMKSWTLIN